MVIYYCHCCARWGPSPSPPKREYSPPIFGPCLLCPNGWMGQDATWYEGRPRPRPHFVRWGPSSPPQKGGTPLSLIFGPCLLWPNGWMDQDATWYEGRPRPRPHCITCGPSSPSQRGHILPNFRSMSIVAKRSPTSATAEPLLKFLKVEYWF